MLLLGANFSRNRRSGCFLCFSLWQDGGTALTVASQYGHSKVVDTLLKNGANVHDQLNVSTFILRPPLAVSSTTWPCAKPACLSVRNIMDSCTVSPAGIQPLRFLQTAESHPSDIRQDYRPSLIRENILTAQLPFMTEQI